MKLKALAIRATVCLFGVVGGGGAAIAGLVTYDANEAFVAMETGSVPRWPPKFPHLWPPQTPPPCDGPGLG